MFSQMARMLDIIQDYLGYRGWYYTEKVVLSRSVLENLDLGCTHDFGQDSLIQTSFSVNGL